MGSITLCDCATAAPIVLDNLRRFEERRPLLNQSDPARGYERRERRRHGLTQNSDSAKLRGQMLGHFLWVSA